ncbi:MAG: AsmA family protein [Candidatus Acidiferrales bacterium]
MKNKPLIIAGGVIVVLLIIVLILPMLIDVNQFKPKIETQLNTALGRKVDIGNISLAIFSGGVAIENLVISDDPAFSKTAFLTAKKLTVGVDLLPLIFSKRLAVRSFTIVEPEVSLWRSSAGVWNYGSLASGGGDSKGKPKGDVPSGPTDLSVDKLEISNGKVTVGTIGSRAKPLVYQEVNLGASDLSYTTQFPFKFSAKDPANGAVKLEGKAGPIDKADTTQTPMNAKIDVAHLDLGASSGFLDPASGIGGLIDFNGDVVSDGHQLTSKGAVKADKLKLKPNGSPAKVTVNVDYAVEYDLKRGTGILKQGDVHIGKALARLSGTFSTTGEEATLQMKMNGQGMPVPDLEGMLPAVGVTLPPGASLQSGTLETNLAISGPVNRLVITGPVNLSNGKLTGFSFGSKLGALSSIPGLGAVSKSPDTEIQTLSMNLRMDGEGIHAQNLNVVAPSIGTVTGDANVSASGQLDCKMNVKLTGGGGAGAVMTKIGAGGGKGGIPFKIEGTTSNPIFVPDVAGLAGSMAKGTVGDVAGAGVAGGKAVGAVGGLFGKKKSQ